MSNDSVEADRDVFAQLHRLETENAQLQTALESRVILEQAKGCVSARCEVPIDVAFEMIRGMARSQQREIHEFAAEIVANGGRFTANQPKMGRLDMRFCGDDGIGEST